MPASGAFCLYSCIWPSFFRSLLLQVCKPPPPAVLYFLDAEVLKAGVVLWVEELALCLFYTEGQSRLCWLSFSGRGDRGVGKEGCMREREKEWGICSFQYWGSFCFRPGVTLCGCQVAFVPGRAQQYAEGLLPTATQLFSTWEVILFDFDFC